MLNLSAIGKGPFLGILLVHGAGPVDMNYGGRIEKEFP